MTDSAQPAFMKTASDSSPMVRVCEELKSILLNQEEWNGLGLDKVDEDDIFGILKYKVRVAKRAVEDVSGTYLKLLLQAPKVNARKLTEYHAVVLDDSRTLFELSTDLQDSVNESVLPRPPLEKIVRGVTDIAQRLQLVANMINPANTDDDLLDYCNKLVRYSNTLVVKLCRLLRPNADHVDFWKRQRLELDRDVGEGPLLQSPTVISSNPHIPPGSTEWDNESGLLAEDLLVLQSDERTRSMFIVLDNQSEHTLRFVSAQHTSGRWMQAPPAHLAGNKSLSFGAFDDSVFVPATTGAALFEVMPLDWTDVDPQEEATDRFKKCVTYWLHHADRGTRERAVLKLRQQIGRAEHLEHRRPSKPSSLA